MSGAFTRGALTGRLAEYADMVRFEHTVFALPFALSAMLLATPPGQWPSFATLFWILLAMVGGRTYAMGLNRLMDARIDGMNPRTRQRAIPAGRVKIAEVVRLILLSAGLLTFATFQLPLICRLLLPVAFLILTVYSYVKRFSSLAHLVLGVALGSSAVGGWLAVSGKLTLLPMIFGFAVMFWVAGFDIIYACQDWEFDRETNLKSIPASLGLSGALVVSRVFHGLTLLLMGLFGLWYPQTNLCWWLALALTAGMLLYEHSLIRGDADTPVRLERINEAFFTVNGRISIGVFLLVLLQKLTG